MDTLRSKAETTGYFTRKEAFEAGHDDRSIQRALRAALWRTVRRGAYTYPDLWPDEPEDLHRLTARAALRKLGDRVALSHTSAALVHGLSLWDLDLRVVHVTRLDGGSGRTEAGVCHHEGLLAPDDVQHVGGAQTVSATRAALETASLGSSEAGLVVHDSLLREKKESSVGLAEAFQGMRQWPEMQHVAVAVALADGRAESVGESRSRWLFHVCGLPMPELQFPVIDHTGRSVGTTDFAWPEHKLLGEFDGKVKYGRLLRPGEQPEDAVFREKRREDLLCETTGWRMIRLVWADLYSPLATATRVRRLMRTAA